MTIEQIKAARALLDWSANQLAQHAGLSGITVRRYESTRVASETTIEAILSTLEAAGIEFIPPNGGGPGVRLK